MAAVAALTVAVTLGAGLSASAAAPCAGAVRGDVVAVMPLVRLAPDDAAAMLDASGYAVPAPRYGVGLYRVVYRTPGADGEPTRASGLLVLPDGGGRRLRVVSYDHGTMVSKDDAPSVDDSDARAAAVLFAVRGYAAVAPDYLGLGVGPGHHPYMDAASEASASLDMLRAARTVAARHGRSLERGVLVTGFSQGGQAAMALTRTLQSGADRYFRAAAAAPVSGPYAVEHEEIPAAFDGRLDPKEATFYFGYWITAMNRRYGLYGSPSEVFRAPYDRTVEGLYDGLHSDAQVFAGVPGTLEELLTPRFLAWMRAPSGALARALRDNDGTCGGGPLGVPVRLYAARGDRDVAIGNARGCVAALGRGGTAATLTDVGDVTHFPSQRLAMPRIAEWFGVGWPAAG